MDESETRWTANERLAAWIAADLREAGIISPERVLEVEQKLASGTAKEGDWRAWIVEAVDGGAGDGG